MERTTEITCPACGHTKEEEMEANACRIWYQCVACGEMMHPKAGQCCVYCSYGSNPCPPRQEEMAA